ncbi:MAG: nitroreductase [Gammaproteobacteria bacterium TMED112]|mgnify:FL=1|nr:MAG: nitroreductase [Gammaproteobacteria bacterium TMED112]|tara:strand:+ start:11766 stop:12329 length:564 start_codon:yes stop_codon:yes gene_type:complete
MNDALNNILYRNSHRSLTEPAPTEKEMGLVFQAALRAPDHAWLRPSSFIEIQGDGLKKLSNAFVSYAKENIKDLDEEKLKKYEQSPFRAPMIVVLVCTPKEHAMVPEVEQIMSTATAGQNILLALNSMGYGGIWRTGAFSFNEKIGRYLELDHDQKVVGYLYIGTPEGKAKKIPELNILDFVTKWES